MGWGLYWKYFDVKLREGDFYMQEKISIIVPIYNVEKYLRRCVASLVKQVYKNIEILLIDDCSTDGSAAIAKEYAERYPQLCRFFRREKNGGLSAARNTGIEISTGKWLAFVDSDDWVTEDYISTMYDIVLKDQPDIVSCNSYYMAAYETGKINEIHFVSDLSTHSSHKEKVARLRFSATSQLFKKELFLKANIEFPEDIWRCEDISTIVPLYTKTEKISIINKPVYYYFQRKGSLSNQNSKNIDINFYPRTIERMFCLASGGFEKELEFRAISEMMYGMVMIMVRSGKTKKDIVSHIDLFNRKFPEWKSNSYLCYLPKAKRAFIYSAENKNYVFLKMLIGGWDKMRRI